MQSYQSCQSGEADHETSRDYSTDLCVLRFGHGLGGLRVQRQTLRDRQQGGRAYVSDGWELAVAASALRSVRGKMGAQRAEDLVAGNPS